MRSTRKRGSEQKLLTAFADPYIEQPTALQRWVEQLREAGAAQDPAVPVGEVDGHDLAVVGGGEVEDERVALEHRPPDL
jgi:hypothetical protein